MPLIKQDALPIGREDLAGLRRDLTSAGRFRVLERGGERSLFIRVASEDPDPVADLEDALEHVADWALEAAENVFLLGSRTAFHVPATTVRPIAERRRQMDAALAAQVRNDVDAHYGLVLLRVPGDPNHALRLGVRLPRATIAEMSEADLARIAAEAGPLIDGGDSTRVRVAYLVAANDHFRLGGPEFFEDIEPRFRALPPPPPPAMPEPELPPPAPPEPEALPAAPEVPPAPPPVAKRPRPTRVINVRPVFELETDVAALPPEAVDQSRLASAAQTLRELLDGRGFEVLADVQHAGLAFDVAAERKSGYPRRVAAKTFAHFGRADAELMLRHARQLEADLLVAIAAHVEDTARRRCLASRVKVITPHEVASLPL